MIAKSFSTSVRLRAEVGSSMTMSRDFIESARAISTICCSATERSRTSARGLRSRPMRLAELAGLFLELAAADEKLRSRLAADEHVLGDRHVGREGEFLVDRDDAGGLRVVRAGEATFRLPPNSMVPASGGLGAGENFEQRRLARAILAEKGVDFGRANFEIDDSSACTPGKDLEIPVMRRSGAGLRRFSDMREDIFRPKSAARPEADRQFAYFTSPRRSAMFRLSLVTATGVSRSHLLGRLRAVLEEVHQGLHAKGALLAGELLDRGGHAAIADLGQRFRQRVEADDGDARQAAALHGFHGTQRHVVIGGDDDLAAARPCRQSAASVTARPLARSKPAVCSNTILYLSAMPSSTLCRPLLRSIAGEAPDWPCRLMIVAPSGNI